MYSSGFLLKLRIGSFVQRRTVFMLILLTIGLGAIAWVRLIIGTGGIGNISGWGIPEDDLILKLRTHRVWAGAVVGAGLGVAGVLLQSLLRNPLAAPDLMGLSAGSGFALTLTLLITGTTLSVGVASVPAMIGAVSVLVLVYGLSSRRGVIDPVTMVLIGVIVSVILGAGTMLLASQMPDRGFGTSRWMMGNLREDLSVMHLLVSSILAAIVLGYGIWSAESYDAGALPVDEAKSIGMRLGRVRLGQLLGAGLLTTISILLAGPIGFVGLVSPHIVRMIIGPRHRGLLIGAALAGAIMVIGSDVLSRLIETGAGRIPIGVLTALLGGPMFLVLLLKQRRAQSG